MKWLLSFLNRKPKQSLSAINRNPETYVKEFLDSLFGYSETTKRTYYNRLLHSKNCFLYYIQKEGIKSLNDMTLEQLEKYINYVKSCVSDRTVNGYVTAVRSLFKFLHFSGHIKENISLSIHQPETLENTEIKALKPELVELFLDTEYGKNPLTKSRNRLILYLFLKTGLRPIEISNLRMGDFVPYKDLIVLSITGKGGFRRDVLVDPETVKILNNYLNIRGATLTLKGIVDDHFIISESPRKGDWKLRPVSLSRVVRSIVKKLQSEGCPFNLKEVTPSTMRNTAKVNEWEPHFIQRGKETEYLNLKEAFIKEDRGSMNRYRVIKDK